MRAVGWFFVPEGHLTVARRFIAGSVRTRACVPGGTPNTAAHAPKPRIRLS
jgi:hypothetical protein